MQATTTSAWILGMFLMASIGAARPGAQTLERYEYRKLVMGTEARLVLYALERERADEAARAAFARIVELDERLSPWKPDSEASRFPVDGSWAQVSEDLATVLRTAVEVANRTDNVFDPFVDRHLPESWTPGSAVFDTNIDACGTSRLPQVFQEEGGRARLLLRSAYVRHWTNAKRILRLDLSAIAKGYAADEAQQVLGDHGIGIALVDIGGDLALSSSPPDGEGWHIALGDGESTSDVLTLAHCGIATSGSTERFVEDGERVYSHVACGDGGVTHGFSTTVVAPSAMLADALATAANALGPERAFHWQRPATPGDPLLTSGMQEPFPFLPPTQVSLSGVTWKEIDGELQGKLPTIEERFPEATFLHRKPGYTELFDGKTLDGWTTKGGRYDGEAIWIVEDGAIVGKCGPNGEGGLLYIEDQYASFDFECEVKMDWPFDSGVFVRMVPPGGGKGLQVTLDARPGGEVGAVYADGFLAHNEEGVEHWLKDEWNHVRVRCTGFETHLEAWVNGHQVTDYRMEPGMQGFAPTGLIGIQVHPDAEGKVEAARFRNLRVKPLPMFGDDDFEPVPETEGLERAALGSDFRPLFDGTTLDGWDTTGSSENYRVEDGVLVVPAEGSGWIRTVDTFRDFRLRLDFKISEMANSGVCLRSVRDDTNPSFSGCEVQILDDFNWERVTNSTLRPYQFTGGLYGAVPSGDRDALRPIGAWNTYEILARGERLACALNGRVLWDVFTHALEPKEGAPFAERATEGCLGFQRYGAPNVESPNAAWFRNVHLQELPR